MTKEQKKAIKKICSEYDGGQYQNGATEPCGVIGIEETEGEPKQ